MHSWPLRTDISPAGAQGIPAGAAQPKWPSAPRGEDDSETGGGCRERARADTHTSQREMAARGVCGTSSTRGVGQRLWGRCGVYLASSAGGRYSHLGGARVPHSGVDWQGGFGDTLLGASTPGAPVRGSELGRSGIDSGSMCPEPTRQRCRARWWSPAAPSSTRRRHRSARSAAPRRGRRRCPRRCSSR